MERVLNLKKGDKCCVAVEKNSNVARYYNMSIENIDEWTFSGEVTTVSKKYITVKFKLKELKFTINDDYRNKYSCGGADYKLYSSKQDIFNEKLKEDLICKILRNDFESLTLNQLQRIENIIKEGC